MSVLNGPRAKFARGNAQLEIVYEKLRLALDSEDDGLRIAHRVQPYPKPIGFPDPRPWTGVTLHVVSLPTLGSEFSLLIGEAMHNFRGALDHTAWELVRRGQQRKLTTRQARDVQFPMAKSRTSFWNQADRRLPGVPQDIRAVVERYQPYRRSIAGRAIRRLRQFTDTDKHRTIVPAVGLSPEGQIYWSHAGYTPDVFPVRHLSETGHIKVGAKLETYVFCGPRENEIEVRVRKPEDLMNFTDLTVGKTGLNYYTRITWGYTLPRSIAKPVAGEVTELATVLGIISVNCGLVLDEIEARM